MKYGTRVVLQTFKVLYINIPSGTCTLKYIIYGLYSKLVYSIYTAYRIHVVHYNVHVHVHVRVYMKKLFLTQAFFQAQEITRELQIVLKCDSQSVLVAFSTAGKRKSENESYLKVPEGTTKFAGSGCTKILKKVCTSRRTKISRRHS